MSRAGIERSRALVALALTLAACRAVGESTRAPAPAPEPPPSPDLSSPPNDVKPPASLDAPTDAPADASWSVLLDGTSLGRFESTSFGGEGAVELTPDGVHLGMGMMLTGIRLPTLAELPTSDYELEVVAARLLGTDFFCGLTFPVGDSCATLICGGWGGALTGLSCLDGRDASDNETKTYRRYEKGRDYTIRLRVTATRISAWIDAEPVLEVATPGRRLSLRTEVLKSAPLGLSSYATLARIRSVRWRRL